MNQENELVHTLTGLLGSQRKALQLTGISRSAWHYRSCPRPPVKQPIPHCERAYPNRISDEVREVIEGHILQGWEQGVSVDASFAYQWDQGVMLGSRRSWWRIGASISEQHRRPVIGTRRGLKAPRPAPVVVATKPGEAWSWDITKLPSPFRGVFWQAYVIKDIYSRVIVGYRVEERECDDLAVEMFQAAIAVHGAPRVVHADSDSAMRSTVLRVALGKHDVALSFNRPYVSNDNPFSEAGFRTMKYRPGYPGQFTTLTDARAYVADYVDWYNHEHKHSGIGLFSPAEVLDGTWEAKWQTRDQALQGYYQAHPERFREQPCTPRPAQLVGINLPATDTKAAD
ncbi:MAG: DDE-type integrase/transposase/recombinase [Micrococcus sp.]|nr:DDE-type integrase/transposase/recombinase [Micrococcus sp.]